MSHTHFGESFDIHGGGQDLLFPHHENERAQTCTAFGSNREMANYWLHNGYVLLKGKKMAKSEGNVVLAKDISLPLGKPVDEKSFQLGGKIACLALLETHYRQPLNMRDQYLQTAVNRWISLVHTIEFALRDSSLEEVKNFCKIAIETPPDSRMLEALCDDLNTPVAMARLRALIKRVDKACMQKKPFEGIATKPYFFNSLPWLPSHRRAIYGSKGSFRKNELDSQT